MIYNYLKYRFWYIFMKYIAEYIWLDKDNILKSKSLTIDFFLKIQKIQ